MRCSLQMWCSISHFTAFTLVLKVAQFLQQEMVTQVDETHFVLHIPLFHLKQEWERASKRQIQSEKYTSLPILYRIFFEHQYKHRIQAHMRTAWYSNIL